MLRGNRFTKQKVSNNYKKNKENHFLVFRSKWEVDFANFLDNHKHVKNWRFDFPFPYFDAFVTKRKATYYIDFKVEFNEGTTALFEIKPVSQLKERIKTKSMRYKKIHTYNYLKNISKFDAVVNFCKKSGQKFYLVQREGNKFGFYKWNEKKHIPVKINNK